MAENLTRFEKKKKSEEIRQQWPQPGFGVQQI